MYAFDPDNYRGIKLLSVFNKVYDILTLLEGWWKESNIISGFWCACKKGLPCAFLLKEITALSLEAGDKCYVAFYSADI